tara:strand:- start:6865 stop:7989 length:1125 start_codon:yes stop_codon:yes gene_type:complete
MSKIFILGDLAIHGNAKKFFSEGDEKWFLEDLGLGEKTFNTVNLESPLIKRASPISKVGPNLGHISECAEVLKNFDMIGLGNNHILDHGEEGLEHTINLLNNADIMHVGAGKNLIEAGAPKIIKLGDIKIGFINWCHHEFCIATDDSAGAFPIDIIKGTQIIKDLKSKCDFIVLFYHGGIEHFAYPTPRQREICHYLSSIGVDLITCQHSHIIGASETYGDSFILYGQGNYLFESDTNLAHWNQGLMLEANFELGKPVRVNMIPISNRYKNIIKPVIADGALGHKLLQSQMELSENLLTSKYHLIWDEFSQRTSINLMHEFIPIGRIGRKLLKSTGLLRSKYFDDFRLRLINKIECEAHVEPFVSGLKRLEEKN